ncbi:MAG: hypothetical protein WCT85_06220 [Parachlamydiales bacterium]|jgi:hypothetical protein
MLFIDTNIQEMPKTEIVDQKTINSVAYHLKCSRNKMIAGLIKIPPKDAKVLPYAELPRTAEDERKITDIVTSLGTYGKVTLLMYHEKRLMKYGDEIRYLHPLKFIGYIFSHSDLKAFMGVAFDDYFKRTSFVKDFAITMDTYDLKNQLKMYLEDFSKEVNVPSDKISPFLKNKDWEGLLKFLIKY